MSIKNNIENIFKETFESFSVKPSDSLWNKINRKLIIKDFFNFNPSKFNFYYTLIIIAAASLTTYNLIQNSDISDNVLIVENHNKNTNDPAQDSNNSDKIITHEDAVINYNNNILKSENDFDTDNKILNSELHNYIIENDYNAKEESNNEVISTEKLAKPLAVFSASENIACEPVAITFQNASENCDRYNWDFGNGETSSLKNPTFVFRTAGTFTVTLTVFSGSISNRISKQIIVNKKPTAGIQLGDNNSKYVNENICFNNTSSDFHKSLWSFGDGNTSDLTHPRHSYDSKGFYKISMICFTEAECSDTIILTDFEIKDKKYIITAPTAFTPDKNGATSGYWKSYSNTNTVFYPIFNYDVSKFKLSVYNKFGAKIFESSDPNIGWNGYYKNKPVETGVYIWECSGNFIDGEKFYKNGSITLLYLKN